MQKIRVLTTSALALVIFLSGGGVMKAVSAENDYDSLRRFSQILDMVDRDDSETLSEAMQVQEGKDQVTLFTCTPYGVNSHRLLVRGHRVETQPESGGLLHVVADAVRIDPRLVTPVIGGVLLGLILLWVLLAPFKRRRK